MVSSFSSHESKAHPNVTLEAEDPQGEANGGAAKDDSPFNYHQARLAFGLILLEFGDTSIEARDTVRGCLTFSRLLCYCTKHMARPNMPKLKPFCRKQMRMTLNGIEHLTNMASQE